MSGSDGTMGWATRRFAWDGFSFEVPEDWNLSVYRFERGVSSLRMEDDASICLEMEWMRPARPMDIAAIRKRYAKSAHELNTLAERTVALEGLPEGWACVQHQMPGKRSLIVAYWPAPRSRFFCVLRLHFGAIGPRKPARVARVLAESFQLHENGLVPWECFDVALRVSRRFRLVHTALEAGRKLLVFEWRLRRLYLWQFSLADLLLKGRDVAAWAVEFLEQQKGIHGVKFAADPHGGITCRRDRRYPIGHFEEIGRWCFRYQAECRHRPERNTVELLLYHYRSEADLNAQVESIGRSDALLPLCFAA